MKRLLLLLMVLLAAPAAAQDVPAPKVHARLVAEDKAVAPGGSITVALEEKIATDWHTYWKNPGDAGAPTEIQWTLPPGWTANAIEWPRPKRLPVGPLMDYGYEGTPWLLTRLTAPANATGTATIKAHVTWLVCKQICIPEEATLTIDVPVGPSAPDPAVAKDFAAARALLPVTSPWKVTYALGGTLDVYAAAPSLVAAHPTTADFFPAHTGLIRNAAPQLVGYAKDGLVLRLTPAAMLKTGGAVEGLLVLTGTDGSVQALEVNAAPGPVPPADFAAPASGGDISLWLAIAFAFLGGLILNVMPCVLPILAMKALSLATHGQDGRSESFSYAAGAVLSFAVLGLAIVLLRSGGAAIGWGFQLQSPIAVAGFALLVFAVGLNLSGLFEVGSVTAGEGLAGRGGLVGAFFTGVLAVAVAAPCTAPFMAAALGFALTQGALPALAVFVSLGLGFALPFLLLGVWPRLLAFIPKPGAWMLTFKQFLAFPMYAAAAWLVWVLAQEAGPRGVILVLGAMILVALAAWLWSKTRDLSAAGRSIGAVAALLVLVGALWGVGSLHGNAMAPAPSTSKLGEPYSPAKLASLRAANRPVFVDATAAWCITCLVNEDAVLSRDSVKSAFASKNVAYLVADWTNQNPEITALLKENGRSGVPLYLYYAPGAATPVILPQILTESGVLGALGS
ncbi:MAG: thioredoxin family protein [Alphaproteobacteria bacterium]|nr:thioredoxin family protein [Alphaproteobacteria bacterium]